MKLVVMKFGGSSVADAGKIKHVASRVIAKKKSGYRLVINCNPDSGQEVYHLHLHLLGGRPLGPLVQRT